MGYLCGRLETGVSFSSWVLVPARAEAARLVLQMTFRLGNNSAPCIMRLCKSARVVLRLWVQDCVMSHAGNGSGSVPN